MAKVIGTQRFVNCDTGEIVETETIERSGDYDFHKIWLGHILDAVEEVGNKKMKVLIYLLDNLNGNNQYVGTCETIAEETGCHRMTVNRLLLALEKADIVTRPHRGIMRINPDMIFKGSKGKRMNILIKYRGEQDQRDMFDEIADIRKKNKA